MISQDDLTEALDRIARTPDGQLLYRWFQRVLMELPLDAHPSVGALRGQAARRQLAGELMGLMAKGIEESAGPASADRPVVFVRRTASAVSRFSSVRQSIAATDPELRELGINGSGALPAGG